MQINNQKQKGIAETAVMYRMTILLNEEPYFRGLLISSNVCNTTSLLSEAENIQSYQETRFSPHPGFPDTEFSFIYN